MGVKIRLYNNSGDDYVDFEGESEEYIKSMPEFKAAINIYRHTKKKNILKLNGQKYDYIILQGDQVIISGQIVNHLNKGYKIQATHVASYGGDNDYGWHHIVHLIKEAY